MIKDKELRDLFQIESEEHLQNLDRGLLRLEGNPDDEVVFDEVFREVHSIKGSARMIGVKDVELIAHGIEDILVDVKNGGSSLSAVIDRIYHALDTIRKLVHEAVTGEPSGENVSNVLLGLKKEDGASGQELSAGDSKIQKKPEISAVQADAPLNISENRELLNLFKADSEEQLQDIETGLLRLETNPSDTASIEAVCRSVHNLKGAAGTIEFKEVEKIAHTVEDLFGALKKGQKRLSSGTIDRIYFALDAIRKIIHAAMGGEMHRVDAASVIQKLAESERRVENGDEKTSEAKSDVSQQARTVFPPSESGNQISKIADYHIDTIRVDTKKLDELITHAGELTVTKTRIAHLLEQVERIVELCEEMAKDVETYDTDVPPYLPQSALPDTITPRFYTEQKPGGLTEKRNHQRAKERVSRLELLISSLRNAIYEDNSRLEFLTTKLDEGIRNIRLLPFSTLFNLFPRMIRDMAKERSKEIKVEIEGGDTKADKRIIEELKDPLTHLLRNAIDHGIETPEERERAGKPRTGAIYLTVHRTDTSIVLDVADDGRGLDIESIKRTAIKRRMYRGEDIDKLSASELESLIFASGFSTSSFITDVSGRGVGLDVVRSRVELLKGTVQVESTQGYGCLFRMTLPTTLATTRTLIAVVNGINYAIPVEFVQTTRLVSQRDVFSVEGRDTVLMDGQPISIARLSDMLELTNSKPVNSNPNTQTPCIVLSAGNEKFGITVDAVIDEREIVLKQHSALLKRVRNVSGSTILANGIVCTILNPQDMAKTLQKMALGAPHEIKSAQEEKKLVILLVEDSITTRTQEKRILEGGGYEVVTAVDGMDALNKMASRSFDAIVSDIMMPNMDGLTLTAKIRQDKKYKELPVILVTTLSSEDDKKRGLEVGANAYIPKPSFDQRVLLDTLRRLV